MPSRTAVERALEERLSPARAAHVRRVAQEAVALAQRFGLPPDAALWAGLLHDWYKEVPTADLVRLAREAGVIAPEVPDAAIMVGTLHGPVAARLLPRQWPELPPSVLDAIDRHTTGDPQMSDLDCVVYVADLIEPERRFAGVEQLRELATRDLYAATLSGMTATLQDLLRRGRRIDPRAVLARNAMVVRLAGSGGGASDPR